MKIYNILKNLAPRKPIDISNAFTKTSGTAYLYVVAYYDPVLKRVWGTFSWYDFDAVASTTTNIVTVDAAYRPPANTIAPAFVALQNNSVGVYYCVFRTDGGVRQVYTSTANRVFVSFDYYLS